MSENRLHRNSSQTHWEQRKALLRDLRQQSEAEGKSVPGLADYLKQMDEVDREMERLSTRNSWNVAPTLEAEDKEKLQTMIRTAAAAGEQYLENVREARKGGKKISLKKGVPYMVSQAQGLLAGDLQTINLYEPDMALTLPQLMEQSRTKTLILSGKDMQRLRGNQNSRIPIALKTPDGGEYRGVYTKADYSRTEQMIQGVIDSAVAEGRADGLTENELGELQGIRGKMRHYLATDEKLREEYPGLANLDVNALDDATVFLLVTEVHTGKGDRMNRLSFQWRSFADHMGLNEDKYEQALREFGYKAVNLRYKKTAQMINTLDLKVKEGSRIDSRNSAMSAVADMMGVPSLLARSTNMRFTDGKGNMQEGTVMDFSKGLDLNDDRKLYARVNDDPFGGPDSWKALKQLADMQILDCICGNVDRHGGNLMYIVDKNGYIVGVQGIDNDSSFGNFVLKNKAYNRLPGLKDMNFISKSMRDEIMGTDPTMLRFSLRGRGLSEEQLDYTVQRLQQVQEAIRKGEEHYKGKKIDANDKKPFDKGFLRVVSDEEFKNLTLKKMYSVSRDRNGFEVAQRNLFSEVAETIGTQMENARKNYDIQFDPDAWKKAEEKKLPGFQTQDQVYSRQGLLPSIEGISRVIRHGDHDIDRLTDSWHGGSREFDEMAASAKRLAEMEKQLAREMQNGQVHLSVVEYKRNRESIARAKEELSRTTDAYLNKKMREKHVTSLDELEGKNPYEKARIRQAKALSEYGKSHPDAPELTEEILSGKNAQAMEIMLGDRLSAEEEAEAAMKMLRKIHEQEGLMSPEEMKENGMTGQQLDEAIRNAKRAKEQDEEMEKGKNIGL